MMTSSNENVFRVTGPLFGEFTGHRWIPLTMASYAELWCFLSPAPEKGRKNNREAGDLRRHRVHHDVIVMMEMIFNPCRREFNFRKQKTSIFSFISLAQVAAIPPFGRQGPIYPSYSISMLMIWRRKVTGDQQQWYLFGYPWIFRLQQKWDQSMCQELPFGTTAVILFSVLSTLFRKAPSCLIDFALTASYLRHLVHPHYSRIKLTGSVISLSHIF